MTDARLVPGGVLSPALSTFASLTWPVPDSKLPGLISALGWSVLPGTEDPYLKADTGFDINRQIADFSSHDATLTSVSFRVSDVVVDETPWRDDFLQDAFASAVDCASRALGRWSSRSRGSRPQAVWDLPSGGHITISRAKSSVSVEVESAEYAGATRCLSR